jgi:hypothetical protein
MFAFLTHLQNQFYFMVDILRKVRMVEGSVAFKNGCIRLQEYNRGGGALVFQFLDMFRVVSSDGNNLHKGRGILTRAKKGIFCGKT